MPVTPEDLHGDAYFADPFPVWERLRHDQPLFHDTIDDRWLLTRYDDVATVFRDHATYSTKPYERIFTDVIGPTMVQMDGADHDVRRAIVAPALVGRQLEQHYLALVETVVDGLFSRLPADGPLDLMRGVTAPLPLKVVATILGLPESEDAYLHRITDRVIAALAGVEPARAEGIAAHTAFAERIGDLIDAREAAPGPDLISAIAHGRTEDGERLSRAEIASFISLLMVAGGETTDRAIATFWWVLLQHPDVLAALRADPSRVRTFVEEVLRVESPVQGLPRLVTQDTELGGCALPAGSMIMLRYGAANRDERQFAEPDRVDLDREKAGMQLAFGSGVHHCIGAPLARQELNLGFPALLARMRNIRLAPGHPAPEAEPSFVLRNLPSLHIAFDPIPAAT